MVVLGSVVTEEKCPPGETEAVPISARAHLQDAVLVPDNATGEEVVVDRVGLAGRHRVADAGRGAVGPRPVGDEHLVLRHDRLGEKAAGMPGGTRPSGEPVPRDPA